MGCDAFVGLWGSGKTLALVEECLWHERNGYRVASNFGYVGGEDIETLTDVLRLMSRTDLTDRIYIALDEAGALFPAREYSKWPPALNVLVQQARKLGISIGWTAQAWEFVDVNLRRVTGTVTHCTGWGKRRVSPKGVLPVEYRPLFFVRKQYNSVLYGTAKAKSIRTQVRRFDPELGRRYDTYRLISSAQRVLQEQAEGLIGST
ncbi:MAG: hypothetical protein AB2L09_02945 [Coriobacteriia bacterium]